MSGLTMNSIANQVAEFHNSAGIFFPTAPTLGSKDNQRLSIVLLREELREYETALRKGDIVAAADALGDLQVVLVRAMWSHGLISRMPLIMREIHRSNMSKFCDTMWSAQEAVDLYATERVYCDIYSGANEKFAIINDDGKILKAKDWSEPDLKSILDGEAPSNIKEPIRE